MKSLDHYAYQVSAILGLRFPKWLNHILSHLDPQPAPFPSPSGLRQFVHPDLFTFHGRRHLAVTPYPFSVNRYENPEIYWEGTGGRWEWLTSVSPPGYDSHLSDPDLLELDDRLFLLYRCCPQGSQGQDTLWLRALPDGQDQEVLRGPKTSLLSPAAVLSGSEILVFTVDVSGPEPRLLRYRFDRAWRLQGRETVPSPVHQPWHLDLAWDGPTLVGLFLGREASQGHRNSLVLASSEDGGQTFGKPTPIRLPHLDIAEIYRSSILPGPAGPAIALSYQTACGRWRTTLHLAQTEAEGWTLRPLPPAERKNSR